MTTGKDHPMVQAANNIDKTRIAKNTMLLYIRMIISLGVGVYTARLLLNSLGVVDYGLYNVIFGIAAAFTFFSNAMLSATQRFLCHELGKGQSNDVRAVFSVSILLFASITVLFFILAETAGLWFVKHKLNFPAGKMETALIVYHASVVTMLFKILQMPYTAVVTSHENMKTFAAINIFESLLYLISVLVLRFIFIDRVIYFSVFYTLVNLFVLLSYALYCTGNYAECSLRPAVKLKYVKSIAAFFFWSLFGSVANISKQHGLNLLLNMFCGVIMNAAWGIATQVGNALNQFAASFQQAFNPQILKCYANSDTKSFEDLLYSCSKYSFLLLWLITLPFLLQTEFILKLWLGSELPEKTVIFTQLVLVYILIDAICGPLWMTAQATGNIKRYQVEISCLIFSSFVFSFIALKLGAPAYSVAVINTAVNAAALLYRLFYLRREIDLHIRRFCLKALLPMATVAAISTICGIVALPFTGSKWYTIIGYLLAVSLVNAVIMLFIGLSGAEREDLKIFLTRMMKIVKKQTDF